MKLLSESLPKSSARRPTLEDKVRAILRRRRDAIRKQTSRKDDVRSKRPADPAPRHD